MADGRETRKAILRTPRGVLNCFMEKEIGFPANVGENAGMARMAYIANNTRQFMRNGGIPKMFDNFDYYEYKVGDKVGFVQINPFSQDCTDYEGVIVDIIDIPGGNTKREFKIKMSDGHIRVISESMLEISRKSAIMKAENKKRNDNLRNKGMERKGGGGLPSVPSL